MSFDAIELLLKVLLFQATYQRDNAFVNDVQNRLIYFLAMHTAIVAGVETRHQDTLIETTVKELLRVRTEIYNDAMLQMASITPKGTYSVH